MEYLDNFIVVLTSLIALVTTVAAVLQKIGRLREARIAKLIADELVEAKAISKTLITAIEDFRIGLKNKVYGKDIPDPATIITAHSENDQTVHIVNNRVKEVTEPQEPA